MDSMKKYKFGAFTLIELLVVISIIAILMSILMPALTKVKGQAKLTLCSNNQHQIVIAVNSYSAEWNNKLPPSIQGLENATAMAWSLDPIWLSYHSKNDKVSSNGLNGGSVGMQLSSYIKDPWIFFCPFTNYAENYPDMEDRWLNGSRAWPAGALASTNSILWNYNGWDNKAYFENKGNGFKGGGDKSSNGLILAERIFYGAQNGTGPVRWMSTHPFKNARRGGGSGDDNAQSWWVLDTSDQTIPKFNYSLNAGYVDGSVRAYKNDTMIKVEWNRNAFNYMPSAWK